MKEVLTIFQPEQAAMFMMISRSASDYVIERLGEKGGYVIRTNLDRDNEDHLRREFQQAHAKALASHQSEKK